MAKTIDMETKIIISGMGDSQVAAHHLLEVMKDKADVVLISDVVNEPIMISLPAHLKLSSKFGPDKKKTKPCTYHEYKQRPDNTWECRHCGKELN